MDNIIVPFTGWEPHNTIRWVSRIKIHDASPYAKVFGREPITTTEIFISGQVSEYRWNKYDRGVTISTLEQLNYKIGGTNTTSSIACQFFLLYVPKDKLDFVPDTLNYQDILQDIEKSVQLPLSRESTSKILLDLEKLDYLIRLVRVTAYAHTKFYEQTPHRLSEIHDLLDQSSKYSKSSGLSLDADWLSIVDQLALLAHKVSSDLKVKIVQIFSLIPIPQVLNHLCKLLKSPSVRVRREVVLAFRSMEDLLQGLTTQDPQLVSECILSVANVLRHKDVEARVYAAEDLGYFSNEHSIKDLVHVLLLDQEEHVRWASVVALGRYESPDKIFRSLLQALEKDKAPIVQRSAMLSIGRILPKLRANSFFNHLFEDDFAKLKLLLGERLLSPNSALASYAAYALGEMHEQSISLIDDMIKRLDLQYPFVVRSNALLALSKLSEYIQEDTEKKQSIEYFLDANLFIDRPTEHPSSAYFDWFLDHAGELLVKIEARQLAARYYQRAVQIFSSIRWRALYCEGIASYELAEYYFDKDDSGQAIAYLDKAIELFQALPGSVEDAQLLSEKVKIGVDFRINMAEARKNIIMAVLRWNAPIVTGEDSQFIVDQFKRASRRYYNVLVSDLKFVNDPNYKRLSREELNLVSALASLCVIGVNTETLAQTYRKTSGTEALVEDLGRVDTEVKNFVRLVAKTKSASLNNLAKLSSNLLESSYSSLLTSPILTMPAIGNTILGIKEAFLKPFPTPAIECRLIGPGRASLQVYLEGASSGSGVENDPYIFISDKRLIFRVIVNVIQRSQNELLILRDHNSPTGCDFVEIVHVHEGTSPQTIDYGILPPAEAANIFHFYLEFKNTGCSDQVDQKLVWVRVTEKAQSQTSIDKDTTKMTNVNVFISYKHDVDDEKILQELIKAVQVDAEKAGANFWWDKDILTGDLWDKRIKEELTKADIALVLVSDAYLHSDYVQKVEIANFIKKRKKEGMIIFPIIASACEWDKHDWLAQTQFIPRQGGQTIRRNYRGEKRKELFIEIRKQLLSQIEQKTKEREPK